MRSKKPGDRSRRHSFGIAGCREADTLKTGEDTMRRRDFLGKSGCGAAAFLAAQGAALALGADGKPAAPQQQAPPPKRKRYNLEIEIYEARQDTWCHKKGDKFAYPQDIGKICPWLLSSLHDFLVALSHGATLSWKYEGTPYEKVIDPDGVTTEYVRCPDPTSNLVAKITRSAVP
jgi:uncharacterized repeat protein (TIGR04076 family)